MGEKLSGLIAAIPVRLALGAERLKRRRFGALVLQPFRLVTILVGAALSVGGVSQAFDGVHFLVQKDLDRVQVVRQGKGREKVVADLKSGFAGNSVYKIARAFPDRYVSEERNLFESSWLGSERAGQELTLINDAIRREFFEAAIPYGGIIHEKAEKYDVDPALVAAVMETESRFRQGALSHRGAMGLMQLMPRTGRWMGAKNLYDPDQNVDAGVKYLKYLQERFDGDLRKTIAAYNAGEGNVKRYGGVPPYRETRTYVKKVLKSYKKRSDQIDQLATEPPVGAPVLASMSD